MKTTKRTGKGTGGRQAKAKPGTLVLTIPDPPKGKTKFPKGPAFIQFHSGDDPKTRRGKKTPPKPPKKKINKRCGYFIGKPKTEWLDDGRTMRLLEDFIYVDRKGRKWIAPKGSLIDGSSIPKIFWTLFTSPFVGRHRNASIVHDVYCKTRTRPHKAVHDMFYYACLAGGLKKRRALAMWAAVAGGGPQWDKQGKDLVHVPDVDPDTFSASDVGVPAFA